ncbi:hypothetical protein KXD40_001051 [Peronospora effusa]|nr:hypothetical protein KXD40_001051 [Peronospora effusa]
MTVESNTAYTKALIVFVALVVNSSTSVAGDTPIPVDAVRTSRALNALNEVNTTLSVQRLLRDTSDVVSNAEERFSITDVPILNSVSEKAAAWLAPKSKEATKLFQVEAFHTWIAYVEKFHPNSVEKVSNAIYSTLASHFSASDLVKLFTKNLPEERKNLAEEVLKAQVQSWIDSKKSGGQVFALLQLDKKKGNLLLRSPAFSQWVSFFREFYKEFSNDGDVDRLLYLFLSSRFVGSWDRLLAGAPANANVAVPLLQRVQLTKWHTDKKSPKEVLKLLKLDKIEGKLLLRSPAFPQWSSYFIEYHKDFPNEAVKWLFPFLSSRFKGSWDVLLARTPVGVKASVFQLLNIQLKKWHTDKRSPEDVFKFLGLTGDTKLFENPLGTIWLNYLYLLKENSDLEVLKILQDKFDDALVARMLYDSFSVNEIAKKLQEAQYKTWKTGTAPIPLGMADKGDGDQLIKMTGAYFNWIKAQYA